MDWLCRAQDRSASADGGVSSHYSLDDGWGNSYPETTGYIVPTMLEFGRRFTDTEVRGRVKRMLDWLVSIQFDEGSFQGGRIGTEPKVAVTFNTGQILIGLAAGSSEWHAYRDPMRRAAEWLVATQDAVGGWSAFPSPLTAPGAKSYEIHTSMGLFEASRVADNIAWGEAALANVDWALGLQRENGWFEACDHAKHDQPLTHTIGYTLRTLLEAYAFSGRERYLEAARLTGDALTRVIDSRGFIPGRLSADWERAVGWACLTGSCQIAECWLLLYAHTGEECFKDSASRANRYVRRTLRRFGRRDTRGGVFGSYPHDGGYCRNQQVNWAAKFFLDAQFRERDMLDAAVGG